MVGLAGIAYLASGRGYKSASAGWTSLGFRCGGDFGVAFLADTNHLHQATLRFRVGPRLTSN